MKELDFLPEHVRRAWRRRYRTRRNVLLLMALVSGLGLLHLATSRQARIAEGALAVLEPGGQQQRISKVRLAALESRRQVLAGQAALLSALDDDAPLDAVIAELGRLMSGSMAMRGLTIEARPAEGSEKEKEVEAARRGPAEPAKVGRTEVVLVGVAANDLEVGMYVGRLMGSPLFAEVRLAHSRETEQQGRLMREFELRLTVKRGALSS